jgi:DNA-binding transcriptional MocR family regulator
MTGPSVVNFLRGVPAEEALTRLVPAAAQGYRDAIARHGVDILQYGHFTGFKLLREQIGAWHGVDPNRVIVGNGGLEAISIFFKSLPKGSTILFEETTYDRVLLDAKHYGHNVLGVRLTCDGVDLEHFEALIDEHAVTLFYGIPFHHNPTGMNYSIENRKSVETLCAQKGILCFWDICYQDLRYDGKQNTPIELSADGPILASSFTKTISPGTKCGYLVLPQHLVDRTAKVFANTRINPNLPTQAFISDFISSGRFESFLGELRDLYRPRMEALNSALSTRFPSSFAAPLTGGFFATVTLPSISAGGESAFIQAAKEAGVGIAAAWDAVAPNFLSDLRRKGMLIRLTFPAVPPQQIALGIERLQAAVARFKG